MKNTNNYRVCPNCPHHSKPKQKPCCCRSGKSSSKNNAINQRKQQDQKTVVSIKNLIKDVRSAYNSIEYIDQSLPLSTIPDISGEYQKVKTRGLSGTRSKRIKSHHTHPTNPTQQNSYGRVAYNDENIDPNKNCTNSIKYITVPRQSETINSSKLNFDRENMNFYDQQCQQNSLLSNKLYQSNRTLQQVILKYDVLSKTNQQLNEKNHEIELECSQLRLSNQNLNEQLLRCKKKMKLMIAKLQEFPEKDYKKLMGLNLSLQDQVRFLEIQRERLSRQLSRAERKQVILEESQNNLSPQWIAQTTNKISRIQHNISKIQQKSISQSRRDTKNSRNINHNINQKSTNHQSSGFQESPHHSAQETARLGNGASVQQIKKTLINSILSINSKLSFTLQQKFSRTVLENVESTDMITLIQIIISCITEGIMGKLFGNFEKQITRKMEILNKKILLLPKRLQNLEVSLANDRLVRGRSRSMCISATRSAIEIPRQKRLGLEENKENNFRGVNFTQSIQSPRCSFSNKANQGKRNL